MKISNLENSKNMSADNSVNNNGNNKLRVFQNIFEKLFSFANICLAILFAIVLSVIIFVNLKYNVSIQIAEEIDSNIVTRESFSNILIIFISIISLVILNLIFLKVIKKLSNKAFKILNIIILSILAILNMAILIIWNKISYSQNIYDPHDVMEAAINALAFKGFNVWYFLKYPWNLGLLGYEIIIVKIFNLKNVLAAEAVFKAINIVYIFGSALMVYMLTKSYVINKIKDNRFKELVINSGIIFLNIPIVMLLVFIYGDMPTIFFSLISILLVLRALEKKDYGLIFLASIPMFVAIAVRQNTTIILIALGIILLMEIIKVSLRMGEHQNLVKPLKIITLISATIVFVFGTLLVKGIIISKASNLMQYQEERIEPVPLKNHIAIGLSETGNAPGWYSYEIAKHSYGDPKIDHDFYKEYFKEKLDKFKSDPRYMLKFFETKLALTWAEPTYNALFYNTTYRFEGKDNPEGKDNKELLKDKIKQNLVINELYYGNSRYKLETFSKTLALISALFAIYYILNIIIYRKEFKIIDTLLMLIFIGGFIYHLLAEIKGRYIMIYNFILFPFAYSGLCIMANNTYNALANLRDKLTDKSKYNNIKI